MAFLISEGPLTPLGLPGRVAPGTRIVPAGERSALGDGQALIAAANKRAEEIVGGAQAAYEAERARGYDEGRQEANLKAADHMIEAVGRTVEYFANVEATMIDVVMQAVRKLISGFDDRDRVAVVVRNALAIVRNQKQVTLRIHPEDIDVAQGRMNDWLAEFPRMGYVDVVPDPRLVRGGCIVESEIGLVEASLDAQLKAMRGAFERVLGSRI